MDAEGFKKEGNIAFVKKDYGAAVEKYTESLKLIPTKEVLCNRAMCFGLLSQYQESLVDANAAIELDSTWSKAHYRKAAAHFHLKEYDEAYAAFSKSVELDPSNDEAKMRQKECLSFIMDKSRPIPSRQQQYQYIQTVLERYAQRRVGDTWYMISAKWWMQWQLYIESPDSEQPDLIDNLVLLVPGSLQQLREKLVENVDYQLLPAPAWRGLHEWFRGGPAIERRVVNLDGSPEVEVYELQLRVHSSTSELSVPMRISRSALVTELRDRACRSHKLDRYQCSVYNYMGLEKGRPLDLTSTLHDAGVFDDQDVMIDKKHGYEIIKSAREPTPPGLTGLYNLGNTCFMNAAVQCLSNTPPLLDYFQSMKHLKELNPTNPLGMKGEMAKEFGEMMKALWAGNAKFIIPRDFKWILSRFSTQFQGYQQHDAHELLGYVLDILHEDCNRVLEKKYVEDLNAAGQEMVAAGDEAWRRFLLRNDSFVADIFAGQFVSELVCTECKKNSITFDPFFYLFLPLPINATRTLSIYVMPYGSAIPTRYSVSVPRGATIQELGERLSQLCRIPQDNLAFIEIFQHKIARLYSDQHLVRSIRVGDVIFAYETKQSATPVIVMHRALDHTSQRGTHQMIGFPLLLFVPTGASSHHIHQHMMRVLEPLNAAVTRREQQPPAYRLRLTNSNGTVSMGDLEDSSASVPWGSKLCLAIDWPEAALACEEFNAALTHESCLAKTEGVSIYDLIKGYVQPESLNEGDWYCSNCKTHRSATKKLDLWRLPEVLVISLKRFMVSGNYAEKIDVEVDFPIDGLDLGPIVHGPKTPYPIYDLFAVVHHFGGMGYGHYTATCKNRNDGLWYHYDDDKVTPIDPDTLRSSSAYTLLYRRRPSDAPTPPSLAHLAQDTSTAPVVHASKGSSIPESHVAAIDVGRDSNSVADNRLSPSQQKQSVVNQDSTSLNF